MNILITGSEGYLGSHLVSYFKKKNFIVYGIDIYEKPIGNYKYFNLDISKAENFKIIQNIKFDLVVHAAAKLAFESNNKIMNQVNIDGTKNIINYLETYNSNCKLIYISTASIFSSNYDHKVKEDSKKKVIDNYGKTKLISENIIINSPLRYIILRCPIIFSIQRSGVISIVYDLINLNKKIPLLNYGNNTFDAIEINDLSDAIYLLSINENRNIYNIGCDEILTFRDIFSHIIAKSSSRSSFINLPKINLSFIFKLLFYLKLSPLSSYHTTMLINNFKFDNSKLKEIGWMPKNNIKELFYESYKYYILNKSIHRSVNSKSHKLGVIKILYYFL